MINVLEKNVSKYYCKKIKCLAWVLSFLILSLPNVFAVSPNQLIKESTANTNTNPTKDAEIKNKPTVIKPGKNYMPATVNSTQKRWTLNQQEIDLRSFIAQVASITGDTFILDPKLHNEHTISVVSTKPMDQNEIYNIFLEVLAANGFAVVPKGRHLKNIITYQGAKVSGANFLQGEKPANATMVTRVIDLHSVSAIEVIPIIRPLIAQFGHAAASSTGNVVVINDLKDNVERITKLVKEVDEASDIDYEVIKLNHAWVSDVAHVIQETLLNTRTTFSNGIQVIADERSNRLVIKGNLNKRIRVRKLVQTLDQEGIRRSSTRVMFLRHGDAKNISSILTEVAQKLPSVKKDKNQASPTSKIPSQLSSSSLSSASSSTSKLSDNIFIKADETTNSLVMIAEPNTLKELEDLVRQLDVRRAQVLIEAAVVEVSGDASQSLGLQWGINGIGTNLGTQTSGGTVAQTGVNSSVTAPLFGNNILSIGSLALRNTNFGVLINAISSNVNTNLLSTPSLLTLDNETAELSVGQEVPFKTGSYANESGGSNPFTTTERKPVGLSLKVVPHIGDGDALRLEIEQEISKLLPNSTSTLGTSDVVTDRRKLKATIIVDDRQTIVLGGLLQDDTKKITTKVPLLGNIPVLGRLFTNSVDHREKKNLMLFIKPSIVRGADSLTQITKDKFNTIRVIRSSKANRLYNPSELFDVNKVMKDDELSKRTSQKSLKQ